KKKLEDSKSVHKIIRSTDYLSQPKPDSGYGGIHLVYSCYEGRYEAHPWKGTNVEIQLRTALQHAWATSLEIIDTLEDIELKTSVTGSPEWRKFFKIAGMLVAHEEELCPLEREEHEILIDDFCTLQNQLDVGTKLRNYNIALSVSSKESLRNSKKNSKDLVLVRMIKSGDKNRKYWVSLDYFKRNQTEAALKELNRSEFDERYDMSVLVSVEGIRSLTKAYPNYFGSTFQFTNFISSQLGVHIKYLRERTEKFLNKLIELESKTGLTEEQTKTKERLIASLKSTKTL
ncbi:RelA/SpoT domain-containing protein, partial [Shewanella baltica]